MTFQPLPSKPGVIKDDSPLEAGLYWIDADKVRFVAGLPETIYGWERVTSSTLLGICRGILTYADNARNPLCALGTSQRLYAMDVDGNVTDITPVTSYGSGQSVSLTTSIGSSTVAAAWTGHGLLQDQKFKYENASPSTIGGVTVNGTYTVASVVDANNITFTAAQTATSTAGPTAVTLDTAIYLATGQADGLGGLGFGTGGYGSGGYGGSSSSVTLYPRTWALSQWGQNLLANPRGDGIYEWAPNVTASELLTTLTAGGSWTSGVGWSFSGTGAALGSAGVATDLYTNVTESTAAWHLLDFQTSVAAGTFLAKHGTTSIGSSISATGRYRLPYFAVGGSDTLVFSKDASFNGVIKNASLKVLTTAQKVVNAPTQVTSMFVTDQRQVVAVGSNLDGTFDALQVDWSDQENNQTWTATSANYAGGYTLPDGGRAVTGRPGNGENLIWTNDSLWSMRYNANPNVVYDFNRVGKECGLVGPNACVQIGMTWYWMTPAGAFMKYDGADITPLPCTLARDVRDHLAWVQGDKVYARALVGKNYAEVWWFYPDSRDGSEVSRYAFVDTKDPTIWSCGTWDITAACTASIFEYPLAVDTSGRVWFHEKGFSADGAARSWSVTGAYRANPGGQIMVNAVRPDHDDLQGGYSITFAAINRDVRGIFSRTFPALSINASTGQRSTRAQGEQVNVTFSGTASPSFWRLGNLLVDVVQSVRKR